MKVTGDRTLTPGKQDSERLHIPTVNHDIIEMPSRIFLEDSSHPENKRIQKCQIITI